MFDFDLAVHARNASAAFADSSALLVPPDGGDDAVVRAGYGAVIGESVRGFLQSCPGHQSGSACKRRIITGTTVRKVAWNSTAGEGPIVLDTRRATTGSVELRAETRTGATRGLPELPANSFPPDRQAVIAPIDTQMERFAADRVIITAPLGVLQQGLPRGHPRRT